MEGSLETGLEKRLSYWCYVISLGLRQEGTLFKIMKGMFGYGHVVIRPGDVGTLHWRGRLRQWFCGHGKIAIANLRTQGVLTLMVSCIENLWRPCRNRRTLLCIEH